MANLEYLQYEAEGQIIDRKRANLEPKKIAEHISAFSNAEGGILVIGIEDDGEITGFKYPKSKAIEKYIEAPLDFLSRLPKYMIERVPVQNSKGEDDEILVFTIEPNYESIIALKDETVFLPKERRKAPCFSYGDIRRTLSCVMWESAV